MPEFEKMAENFYCIAFENMSVYFSYGTPIAFKIGNNPSVVCENIWSKTTGKHLNSIDGGNKKNRVKYNEFKDLWNKQIELTNTKMMVE